MKLKELNDAIAEACDLRPNVVSAVQEETFKQIRATLEKGEKVSIPDFGIFVVKDVTAENAEGGARKMVRFRERAPEEEAEKKAKRAEKKAKKAEAGGAAKADDDDEGDED